MADYTELVEMLRTCSERDSCVGWDKGCPYLGTGLCDDKAGKAADAIEELVGISEQLPRWISVTERIPEDYLYVLCCGERGGMFVGNVAVNAYNGGAKTLAFVHGGQGRYITHWMPLPAPPKEET